MMPNEGRIRFDNRVAIITGAGAGIGRVYALEFAKRGAKVVVNDLGGTSDGSGSSAGPADSVVQEIKDRGGEVVASYDSVATPEGGESIVKTALDAFGQVDIVVNNAGILRNRSFTKLDPEAWQAVNAVHLFGAYCVTRPAFIRMREKGYGRIVMTASMTGLYGDFGAAGYASAKMGVVGLMNALKIEGAKYNIKVNAVAPIATTRLTEDILPPEMADRCKPEYVAPLVLALCAEGCTESGSIYNCGMGYYNRAAILTGPGAVVGGGDIPTPEQLLAEWDKISSLEGAKEYGHAAEQFADLRAITSKGCGSS
jgi:NAD(P)-dependent dehydrogenase (short-subunit alcohol dehydrogenase family)